MAEIKTSDILNASEISKDLQDIIDKFNQLLAAMKQTSGEFQKSTNSTKKMTEADKKAAEEKKQQIEIEKRLVAEQKKAAQQRQKEIAEIAKAEKVYMQEMAAKQKQMESMWASERKQQEMALRDLNAKKKADEKAAAQREKDLNKLIALEEKAAAAKAKATQSAKAKDEKAAIKAENEAKKESIRITKQQESEQKKLTAQRNKEIAAIQKQQQKQQEVARAANMEVKSDADLNAKLKAQIELRSKLNRTTAEGKRAYDNMTKSISALYAQQNEANKSFGKFTGDVGKYPKLSATVVAAYAAIAAAAKQVYAAVKESIDLFIEQEKQTFRVQQAFGDYAGVINAAADANQAATTVGNEQFQKLAVLAHSYGVENKNVNETVKQSIGLATSFEAAGIGQEQALKLLVKAQNGQYQSLKRIIPEIGNAKNQQEALDIINRKAAEGYAVAQKYAETYGGKITQVKNVIGDMKEEIGGQVLGGLFSIEEGQQAVNIVNQIAKAIKDSGIVMNYFKGVSDLAKMIFEPIQKIAESFGLANDAGGTLTLIFDGLVKWMQIMSIPAKMFWAQISNGVDITIGLFNIFKNLKDFKIQDIFNIANKAITNLLEPITDLIGATDDVKKFFGVARDEINLTAQEQEKFNKLLFDYKAIMSDAKNTIALNNELKNQNSILEEEAEALEAAEKAYESYLAAKAKANEESKLSIALGNSELEVESKKLQAIYDATKAYYELNGYTEQEIKELQELKKQISDVNAAIAEIQWNEELSKWIQNDIENVNKLLKNIEVGTTKITFKAEIPEEGTEDLSKKFTLSFGEKLKKAFKNSKGFAEAIKSFFGDEQVGEAAQGIVDAMGTIGEATDTVFDRQLAKIDAAAKKNADYWDSLMKNYNQDSAEYQQLLAQKEAAQEQYQNRLVELERKKAAFDKVKALIDIAINTAKGIISALASGNPILSAAIGVTGAVQAGVVASQPLPQYYVGLDSAEKDHFGSVAERGAELVNYPDGTSELFTKPTITFIPKYTSIDTAAETAKKLAGAQFTADLTELNNSSRESIKYLGIIARNTQVRQSATDIHYINKYLK